MIPDPLIVIGPILIVLGLVVQYFIIKGAVAAAIRETRNDPPKAETAPPAQ